MKLSHSLAAAAALMVPLPALAQAAPESQEKMCESMEEITFAREYGFVKKLIDAYKLPVTLSGNPFNFEFGVFEIPAKKVTNETAQNLDAAAKEFAVMGSAANIARVATKCAMPQSAEIYDNIAELLSYMDIVVGRAVLKDPARFDPKIVSFYRDLFKDGVPELPKTPEPEPAPTA